MAKTAQLNIRIDDVTKAALEKAAAADVRTTSSLIHKILADWVAEHPSFLPPGARRIGSHE